MNTTSTAKAHGDYLALHHDYYNLTPEDLISQNLTLEDYRYIGFIVDKAGRDETFFTESRSVANYFEKFGYIVKYNDEQRCYDILTHESKTVNIGEIYRVNGTDYVVIGGYEETEIATVVPIDKVAVAEKYFRPMDMSVLTERIGEIENFTLKQIRNRIKIMLGWT